MTSSMADVPRCRRCGERPVARRDMSAGYIVRCLSCGLNSGYHKDLSEAISGWKNIPDYCIRCELVCDCECV